MRSKTKTHSGFTLVEIMIVVAIIGMLAAIAIPNFVRARTQAQTTACIANLKQIEGAKQSWAVENRKGSADVPTDNDLFGPNLYIKKKPNCPGGGNYALNAVQTPATCTIPEHVLAE